MIIPRGPGQIRNHQTTTGRMESSGTQQSTMVSSFAMNMVQRYQQEKDETQFQEAINNTLKKKNEWKAKNLTREGKAAEGLTEDYLAFNKEVEEEIGSNLSNNARHKFAQWHSRDTEQDKLGVMLHQRKQDQFVKQSAFNEGLTLAEEGIRQDAKGNRFKAFEHAELTLQNGLNAGVIPPEQYETKRIEVMNRLRTETAKSYYTQDKHDFMKSGINELGLGETEVAYWKEKYNDDLLSEQRAIKTVHAESANILWSKRDDFKAQAIANKDTSHYLKAAEEFQKMGYDKYAQQMLEEKSLYDHTNGFFSKVENAPLKEVHAAAMSLEVPKDDIEGSGVIYKGNLTIQKEAEKKVQKFMSDPAEYVSSFEVGNTPEEIASSRLSLQEKQGFMPKGGYQVLTKQQKDSFKATWDSGNLQQRSEALKGALEYGKHAPRVIRETGLNSALILTPMLARSQKDMDILVSAVSIDKNPAMADMDDKTKKDYTDEARKSKFFQVLARTQGLAPTNEGLLKNITDVQNAIVGASAIHGDPQAGREFFDSKIKTFDSSDKTVFFPADIDEDELEEALDHRKRQFKSSMPNSRINDAVWVNTSTGMTLLDPVLGLPVPGTEFDFNKVDDLIAEKKERQRQYRDKVSFAPM